MIRIQPEGKAASLAKLSAVTKTATKSPPLKSLSDYIQERFEEFSRSQKDVARYIVDHLDEAAFLTAEELARRASTSSSTVVRFSQALGFEGYPELQQAAIEEYRTTIAAVGSAAGPPGPGRAAPASPGSIPRPAPAAIPPAPGSGSLPHRPGASDGGRCRRAGARIGRSCARRRRRYRRGNRGSGRASARCRGSARPRHPLR